MISELQREKLARLFHLLDADGNGVLEAADLERIAGELAARRGWEPESDGARALHAVYREMWQQVQPFGSGDGLTLAGFVAYYRDALVPEPDAFEASIARLSNLTFSSLDADGDGRITLEEHRTFCEIFNFDPLLADVIFPMWDTDDSGFVSNVELAEVVRQFFYSNDADAPGNWLFGPLSSSIEEIRKPRV